MAVITPAAHGGRSISTLRNVSAQATTGQTDWVVVPPWADFAYIEYNLTAVAGTTPLVDVTVLKPLEATPNNDTGAIATHAALTQITGAATLRINVGPTITTDITTAATGLSDVGIQTLLPNMLGLKVLNDRTTGDETYTYTLTIRFGRVGR